MTDDFVTGDGSIPVPAGLIEDGNKAKVCDEVTLRITFLVWNRETDRLVVRFNLDSPYWIDEHEAANGDWSLALPRYEMLHLIGTLTMSKFMKVVVKNEDLLK